MKVIFARSKSLVSVSLLALVSVACGGGDSSDSVEEAAKLPQTPATTNASLAKLSSGTEVMGFALNSLGSSVKARASGSASLNLMDGQGQGGVGQGGEGQGGEGQGGMVQDDAVHPKFPQCSEHGEAYKASGTGRMMANEAGFSERTLFCQMNVPDSAETILGSLTQAKTVLCSVEKSIGEAPEYTEAGKVYKNVKLKIEASCGWDAEAIEEMSGRDLVAKLTARSYSKGDWAKSMHIEAAGSIDFTLFYTVKGDVLAIKKVEKWTQSERCAKDESSCSADGLIASNASGSRGDVIAIDLKSGVLRAETTDNYWGRRVRALVKGELDEKGRFTDVDALEILNSTIYVQNSNGQLTVSGKVASAKGTKDAGIAFKGGEVTCGMQQCSLASLATSGTIDGPSVECSKAGGCKGNAGFSFAFSNKKVLDFIRLGADFDTKGGSRSANEKWLKDAGIPQFEKVDFSATVE